MVNQATVKKIKTISPVWIVPIAALFIAVWLAVQARLEQGQEIQITFSKASDIISGQTQIRFKDVKVGTVKKVRLSKDLKTVIVRAEIDRSSALDRQTIISVSTRSVVPMPSIASNSASQSASVEPAII